MCYTVVYQVTLLKCRLITYSFHHSILEIPGKPILSFHMLLPVSQIQIPNPMHQAFSNGYQFFNIVHVGCPSESSVFIFAYSLLDFLVHI